MATTTSKPLKKLGQFLEEQQEPFLMEIYLLERGCQPSKNFNSDKSSSSTRSSNTTKRCIFPECPKPLKVVYNKLVSINTILKKLKNNNNDKVLKVNAEEATPQSFRVCNPEEKEVSVEEDQWRQREESKQISPVSVLEGIPSSINDSPSPLARQDLGTSQEENPSKSYIILTKKISEDSILSASLWNLFFHSAAATEKPPTPSSGGAAEELKELIRHKPASEFLKSKRVLQQTKQLLFDCVREVVVETQGKEKSHRNRSENLESELLGEIICEKIKAWRRQSGGRLKITELLDSDYQDSAEEWTEFEPEIKEIAMEIGDAMLEEIRAEIVADMVYFSKL